MIVASDFWSRENSQGPSLGLLGIFYVFFLFGRSSKFVFLSPAHIIIWWRFLRPWINNEQQVGGKSIIRLNNHNESSFETCWYNSKLSQPKIDFSHVRRKYIGPFMDHGRWFAKWSCKLVLLKTLRYDIRKMKQVYMRHLFSRSGFQKNFMCQ